jgi:hypothetical protein
MSDSETARLKRLIELLDEVAADTARLGARLDHSPERRSEPEGDPRADTSDLVRPRRK